MQTLMLNAEDIQSFGKLLPHAAVVTANNNHNLHHIDMAKLSAATPTMQHANISLDDRNLVTLQYYLKHPTTNAATLQQQQQQHQQQQQQQHLIVTQAQLKQLPLKQPTSSSIHNNNNNNNNNNNSNHNNLNNYHATHHSHHNHHHQHHHHPYYQPQQHQQQQLQTSHQHQHHQQQQQQQQHIKSATSTTIVAATTTTVPPVLPVHALNQNSNFSAASSSTGGTGSSSHAPTQQSNTTGCSFSPPGATANKRTTPASSNNTVSSTTNARLGSNSGTASAICANTTSSGGTKKLKIEPVLSQFHQSERLAFANSHITWSEDHWKTVVFHDERKFNLDGPDGFSYYFHDLRNYERSLSQRPRGNSVFVYIVISAGGPIHMDVATVKQKPETSIETILRERANIATKLGVGDFLLQDHNWSASTLPTAQEWLGTEGVKLQKWPAIAHDLNIMENIWGWLIREVYDGGRKFSRKDDLIFRIREAWERLPIDLITNLYSTLPERITELYYTRGVYTNC